MECLECFPRRCGLKLFCICDFKPGFVQHIFISIEKDTEVTHDKSLARQRCLGPWCRPSWSHNIWTRIMYCLFMDNWNSSPKLFEFLLSRQTGACGTVRRQRKNMSVITPLPARGNVVHKFNKQRTFLLLSFVTPLCHSQSLSG